MKYPYRQKTNNASKEARIIDNQNIKDIESDIKELLSRIQNLIINASTGEVQANDARLDLENILHNSLKARLDSDALRVLSKADLSYVEVMLASAVSGAPKGVYNTLTALKNAYPSGTAGVFLVLENGHIYIWNGTLWADAGTYQGIEIGNGAVTPEKTSFIEKVPGSINVLNPSSVKLGWYDPQTGTPKENTTSDYGYTDYIPVTPGDTLKSVVNLSPTGNGFRFIAAFDENKNLLKDLAVTTDTGSYTVPSGVRYVICTMRTYTLAINKGFMIIKGSTIPSQYVEYQTGSYKLKESLIEDVVNGLQNKVGKDEVGSITPELVSFMELTSSVNKFNKDSLTLGFIDPSTGKLTTSTTTLYTTDFIATNAQSYFVSSYMSGAGTLSPQETRFIAQYDVNKNPIPFPASNYQYLSTVQLDSKTRFVKATYHQQYLGREIQIEFNDTGKSTTYSEFELERYTIKPEYIKGTTENNEQEQTSPLRGRKVVWLGSSITQGYGWCQLVNNYFDFVATNCGVGGTTVVYESISSMCTKERLLGQYSNVTDPNTGETTANGVAIPSDVEIIFWEGGTNDWARNWPLGNTKEITYDANGNISLDTSTFYGACHQALKNMTELFPNAIIIPVGTPFGKMPNRGSFTNKYGLLNNQGIQSVEYGDALVDVCGMWGFKGFNFGRAMKIHDNNVATLLPDGLHLTTEESKVRAAKVIINELSSIVQL